MKTFRFINTSFDCLKHGWNSKSKCSLRNNFMRILGFIHWIKVISSQAVIFTLKYQKIFTLWKNTSYSDFISCSALSIERNMFKNQRKCNKQKILCFWRWIWIFFHSWDGNFSYFHSIVLCTHENIKNPVSHVKYIPYSMSNNWISSIEFFFKCKNYRC